MRDSRFFQWFIWCYIYIYICVYMCMCVYVCMYICVYRIANGLHGLHITEILVKRHKLASYNPAIRLVLMHRPV